MTKSFDKQEGGTKRRILDAALEALRTEGFAGATSRAIARIGGFNQALIFYHFGSLARPELAPQLLQRMETWITFCEDAIAKTLGHSPAAEILPARELAFALVTFYLGVNLVTHLDGDSSQTDTLFERAVALAPLLEQLLRQQT